MLFSVFLKFFSIFSEKTHPELSKASHALEAPVVVIVAEDPLRLVSAQCELVDSYEALKLISQ